MRYSGLLAVLLSASALAAQDPGPMRHDGPFPSRDGHPTPFAGPGGKWWTNPEMVRRLNLTADQQKKMDDVLQQSRIRLIDLTATLEKEEVVMEGLLKGPQLDDSKIIPSIDRIAQARAELEKANARLMLAIRHVLTPEQWQKLQAESGPRPRRMGPMNDGRQGAGEPGRGEPGPMPRKGNGPGGPPPAPAPPPREEE